MDYYIAPEEPETDFLRITRPEEIRICDPACGSGYMLTYAFDLLYAIYEEEGYDTNEIPALILTHNLTGVEIDDRAGALAAFALSMKAASQAGATKIPAYGGQAHYLCVAECVGVKFAYSFDNSGSQHARHIVTDTGWKISLDRGIDRDTSHMSRSD